MREDMKDEIVEDSDSVPKNEFKFDVIDGLSSDSEFESIDSVQYQKVFGTEERIEENARKSLELEIPNFDMQFDMEFMDTLKARGGMVLFGKSFELDPPSERAFESASDYPYPVVYCKR